MLVAVCCSTAVTIERVFSCISSIIARIDWVASTASRVLAWIDVDALLDLLRGQRGLARELLHLVRDDCEAAARVARARGFDGAR